MDLIGALRRGRVHCKDLDSCSLYKASRYTMALCNGGLKCIKNSTSNFDPRDSLKR